MSIKRVDSYLITKDTREYSILKGMEATAGFASRYESNSSKILLTAYNFPSADNALGALHVFKLEFKNAAKEGGPKEKGGKEVGQRLMIGPDLQGKIDVNVTDPSSATKDQPPPKNDDLKIVWTNGSVLFYLISSRRQDGLRFEEAFPY